jgi:hypothetical protein
MLLKTIRVNNPKNVLVQIPGCISATWGLTAASTLEMHYDEESSTITIRPYVQRRRDTTK